jgi:hypothetical protein
MLSMKLDPITKQLDRFAWLLWFVLVMSLAFGFGSEIGLAPGGAGVGVGYDLADTFMTVMSGIAALALLVTQAVAFRVGNVWERMSRWLMLLAQSIFAFRFATMLVVNGDIYAAPITVIGFTLVAFAQIVHCMGVLARAPVALLAARG